MTVGPTRRARGRPRHPAPGPALANGCAGRWKAEPGVADLAVTLPAALGRFGATTTARLAGHATAPLVAALGGISGDRFVCRGIHGGAGWWPDLVGHGCAIDPGRHRILGLDFAADATGRAAPSTQDQADVLAAALDAAGRERFDALVGASYGGMVALSFAERFPDRVAKLAIISADAAPHPVATAARELQRRVVALGIERGAGDEALSIARGMAMLTYRTRDEYDERFIGGIDADDPLARSAPGAYLHARGRAFRSIMSPERFLSLSASIDRHRADPSKIACPVLLIGADSDQLVPPSQMQAVAQALGGRAQLHIRGSRYGHDMFLKEADALGRILHDFLEA